MWIELFIKSTIINALFSFSMTGLVLFSRPLTKVKLLWALMCTSVGVWSVGLAWMSGTTSYESALIGSRIVTGSSILIPVFLFHTVQALLGVPTNAWTILFYINGMILNLLNSQGILMDVRPAIGFAYYTSAKPIYTLFMIHLYFGFTIVEIMLWRAAQKASPLIKKQLMSLFWGTTFGFLGGQMTVPLVYGVEIFPWGVFFVPLYVLLVGHGMLKYQFMDFRVALRKLGMTLGIYLCLAILVLPIAWPLVRQTLEAEPDVRRLIINVAIAFTLMIAAGPIIYALIVQRSFWLKSQATLGLVHELKSPLASIRGALELLPTAIVKFNSGKLKDYSDIIQRNTSRLEMFVEDLLNIAAIQEREINLEQRLFSLNDVALNVAETYRPIIEQKGLSLVVQIQEPIEILGDQAKVRQVVSNLLSNAVKFSTNGAITVGLGKNNKTAILSVTDQGKGIDPKNLARIFDRFFQEEKSPKGAGIGLAIAKAWVEAHGGRIWAESEGKNKGSQIILTLPL